MVDQHHSMDVVTHARLRLAGHVSWLEKCHNAPNYVVMVSYQVSSIVTLSYQVSAVPHANTLLMAGDATSNHVTQYVVMDYECLMKFVMLELTLDV